MRKLSYAFVALGTLSLLIILLWGAPVFGSRSVCSLCGHHLLRTEVRIPMTFVTLWTSEREAFTPLSRVIHDAGFAHAHAWVFERGAGNGIQ